MCSLNQQGALLIKFAVLVSMVSLTLHAQTAHSVTLTWNDTLNPPGTTYNVYRALGLCNGPPVFSKIATAVATKTFTDTPIPSGGYCYEVTAALNGSESAPSNTALALVPYPPAPPPDLPPLYVPKSLL